MRPVRLMALGSISLAALLSVTAPAVANAAIQQVQSTRADGSRVLDDEEGPSQRCDDATPFDATKGDVQDSVERQPSPPVAGQPAAPRAGPRDRPFVAVLMAVPLVTYAGATGSRGSEILTGRQGEGRIRVAQTRRHGRLLPRAQGENHDSNAW